MKNVLVPIASSLAVLSLLIVASCSSEEATISVLWSRTYGGTDNDGASNIHMTSDGGYVVGSTTESFGASGSSILIVKLTVNHAISWQKAFGASYNDELAGIYPTGDGGFVICGQTGPAANRDALVMKLSSDGSIEWQKSYGRGGWDWFTSIREVTGGFLAVGDGQGESASGIWVAKLDTSGNVLWEYIYGGSQQERTWADVQQTADGGFIIAGRTESFGEGDSDAWVLKLDAAGGVDWQKTYGGTELEQAISIQQTTDGGYIMAARTRSYGQGDKDVWILKLTSNGSITWQKTYGGAEEEEIRDIKQTPDGGFIALINTVSFGSGDTDIWALKLNANGNIDSQKLLGGTGDDSVEIVRVTSTGNYRVVGKSDSFGAGDDDIWVFELTESSGSGCIEIKEISAEPQDLTVSGADTAVTGVAYGTYTPADLSLISQDVTATERSQCDN